jgi:uncharacterized membrane protein YphA (DoxX/SURF4 family)
MRFGTSSALLYRLAIEWQRHAFSLAPALSIAEGLSTPFLVAGLATPFWAATIAVIQLWRAYADPGQFMLHALLATLSGSVAMLGAGAISVDAWIFGWRRIDVPNTRRDRGDRTPEG